MKRLKTAEKYRQSRAKMLSNIFFRHKKRLKNLNVPIKESKNSKIVQGWPRSSRSLKIYESVSTWAEYFRSFEGYELKCYLCIWSNRRPTWSIFGGTVWPLLWLDTCSHLPCSTCDWSRSQSRPRCQKRAATKNPFFLYQHHQLKHNTTHHLTLVVPITPVVTSPMLKSIL